MSRSFRKLYGNQNVLPPPADSDEDFEPLYSQKSNFTYEGLEVNSGSEPELLGCVELADVAEAAPADNGAKKKKKPKHKKSSKAAQRKRSSSANIELDEIDRSVMEVNKILGTVHIATNVVQNEIEKDPHDIIMSVEQRHLNAAYELNRLFGPEISDEKEKRRGRERNQTWILRKSAIIPMNKYINVFKKCGLSMSVSQQENNITYLTFDHSPEYQKAHRVFLIDHTYSLAHAQKNFHVEVLLEYVDAYFAVEEYTSASNLLEQILAYMQFVAHPKFVLTGTKTRLEYKVAENRPFHIVVLKYLYLLTNKACHRTALELAKMLLNLDPSDPLAILTIIDTLALRAREHQWLIDAIDFWTKERNAHLLFNMQYSYALAYFHVLTKKKEDVSFASDLLEKAFVNFPAVLMQILNCASYKPPEIIKEHPFFNNFADNTSSHSLKQLSLLYANFTYSKWREPPVISWLVTSAIKFLEKYDASPDLKASAVKASHKRFHLFKNWPEEMHRHLCIISPMSELIADNAVPPVETHSAADPKPPRIYVDRYGYRQQLPTSPSHLRQFLMSMLPMHQQQIPNGPRLRPPAALNLDNVDSDSSDDEHGLF